MPHPWLTEVIAVDALKMLLQGFRRKTGSAASAYCEPNKPPVFNEEDLNSLCRHHLSTGAISPEFCANTQLASIALGSKDESTLRSMENCPHGLRQVARPIKHGDGTVIAVLYLGGVQTDERKAKELAAKHGTDEKDIFVDVAQFQAAVTALERYARDLEAYYNAHVTMMGYIQNRTIPMTYTGISQAIPDFLSSFHEDLNATFDSILRYLNLEADSRLSALLILDRSESLGGKQNDTLVVRRVLGLKELERSSGKTDLRGPEVFALDDDFVKEAIARGEPDCREGIDVKAFAWKDAVRALGVDRVLALPLLPPGDDAPIGAIICFPEKEIWSVELSHFKKIAEKAAVTVNMAIRNEQYENSKKFSDGLVGVSSLEGQDFYSGMARLMNRVISAGATSIFIIDRRSGYLRLAGTTDNSDHAQNLLGENVYKLGEGITGEVAQRKPDGDRPYGEIVYDLYADSRRSPKFAEPEPKTAEGKHSMMLTQILSPDHEVIGVIRCIDVVRKSRGAFNCFNHFSLEGFKFWADLVGIIHTLRESMRLNHEFLLTFAHEFGSSLMGLRNNMELAKVYNDRSNSPGVQLKIDDAVMIAEAMSQYLDDLRLGSLVATKGRFMVGSLKDEWLDLERELLMPMKDSFLHLALSERKIGIEYRLVAVELRADRRRMIQVFTNLLRNAIKYSYDPKSDTAAQFETKGIEIVVRFGTDGLLYVDFINEGIGIPDAEKEMVFEQYRKGSNAGIQSAGGLGLGLFICREIMRAHKGDIFVTSCKNPTIVTLRFPQFRVRKLESRR